MTKYTRWLAIVTGMKSPAVRGKLDRQGFVPVFDTPGAFAASLKRQGSGDVIRRHGIAAE